jgi:molecular chaperone GrpE
MEEPAVSRQSSEEQPATEPVSAEQEAVEQDLDDLVEDLKKERDEYLDLAQRARADFENYRRRAAREGEAALARGKAEVGRAVLPAVDALERAIGSPDGAGPEPEEPSGDALAEGLALVHRELVGALEAAGIQAIDPVGEAFDPNLHEALSSRPAEDGQEAGVVAETVQRGYRLADTLIRPARVVVTS